MKKSQARSIRVRSWALGVLFAIALTSAPASAEPVAVRYAESITHGFLLLRGANDDVLAYGELVQGPVKGQRMQSRLVFRFKDGSLWDETVTFTQQKVFRLMSYHHVERRSVLPRVDRGDLRSRHRPLPGQGRR